jgi:hypothetical protein
VGGPFPVAAVHAGATGTATVAILPADTDGDGLTDDVDPDDDNDGIPDTWEAEQGLNGRNAADAPADADSDTFTARQEFVAGTVPTNGASYLRIDAVGFAADVTLRFATATGRVYAVEVRGAPGGPDWSELTNGIAGTGGPVDVADPAGAAAQRTYRVRVSLP